MGLIADAGYAPVDLGANADAAVMEAPRRPGAVYGEEYRLPDAEKVVEAVRAGEEIPPTPELRMSTEAIAAAISAWPPSGSGDSVYGGRYRRLFESLPALDAEDEALHALGRAGGICDDASAEGRHRR